MRAANPSYIYTFLAGSPHTIDATTESVDYPCKINRPRPKRDPNRHGAARMRTGVRPGDTGARPAARRMLVPARAGVGAGEHPIETLRAQVRISRNNIFGCFGNDTIDPHPAPETFCNLECDRAHGVSGTDGFLF